jgi:hypothetical protein
MKLSYAAAAAALSAAGMLGACGANDASQAKIAASSSRNAPTEQEASSSDLLATKSHPADRSASVAESKQTNNATTQTPEQRLEVSTKDLRPDMAYVDFRSLALSQGWQPLVDPDCKLNVAGESDGQPYCSKFPDSASCKLCDELPELNNYSNDLYSLMQFRHPETDKILRVTGWGEIERWRETGTNRAFVLKGWRLSDTPER